MSRTPYPSDLSDAEWHLLEPLLPPSQARGRPIKYPRREVVNAIRYVLRTGCAWRMLPNDLPPWQIAFHYFSTWRSDGTWEHVYEALREQVRLAEGRAASPTAAAIDSQSVKTTERGASRLRCREEGLWEEASHRRRHPGTGADISSCRSRTPHLTSHRRRHPGTGADGGGTPGQPAGSRRGVFGQAGAMGQGLWRLDTGAGTAPARTARVQGGAASLGGDRLRPAFPFAAGGPLEEGRGGGPGLRPIDGPGARPRPPGQVCFVTISSHPRLWSRAFRPNSSATTFITNSSGCAPD